MHAKNIPCHGIDIGNRNMWDNFPYTDAESSRWTKKKTVLESTIERERERERVRERQKDETCNVLDRNTKRNRKDIGVTKFSTRTA